MNSPILFMVFNRPNVTQEVFSAIREAQPSRLYLASDGPRKDREGETELCNAVQNIISAINWECEVFHLARDANLGCKLAVSGAIDWFFSHESEGIILEDDCLPHPDFFRYCDELLEKYRIDERVGLISGTSFGDLREQGLVAETEDFVFSRYPSIWGWATWRRVWNDYDVNISLWKEYYQEISMTTQSIVLRKKNDQLFENVYQGKINTWDYQVSFLLWSTARLAIAPRFNLIQNIGFGPNATHTIDASQEDARRVEMSPKRLSFPLKAPKIMTPNYQYQRSLEQYAAPPFFTRILKRLRK